MEADNGLESLVDERKLEGSPHSPAEAGNEELLNVVLVQVIHEGFKTALNCLPVLGFYILDDFGAAHIAGVGVREDMGQIDIVTEIGKSVSHTLMASTGGSEDIFNNNEHPVGGTDVVSLGASGVKVLSLGLVVDGEGGPGSLGAATSLFFLHLITLLCDGYATVKLEWRIKHLVLI